MVTYSTNELISSSEFSKKFGSYLKKIKDKTVDKLAILKNNKVEAVLISKDEYERMQKASTYIESQTIINSIKDGLDDIKQNRTYPIDNLWKNIND
jgi:prevent-host-death family protein